MALSTARGMAYSCIVFGFVIAALSFGCIAAGAVAISKLNEPVSSIGLWAIYFFIPSVLLLVTGFGRYFTLLAISIAANVLGILIAFSGLIYAAGLWAALNAACNPGVTLRFIGTSIQLSDDEDKCTCADGVYSDAAFTFDASCSDLDVVRNATAAVTILYVLLMITCFVGSIIGCVGACFRHRVPRKRYSMPMSAYVIPYGSPNDAMMTRIQERRHFDYDAYPTTGRYGYERGYIEEVPYYDRERYYSRAPNYHREPLKKQYYQERFYNNENQLSSIPNVPRQPDRTERNLFPGHTNDAFLY